MNALTLAHRPLRLLFYSALSIFILSSSSSGLEPSAAARTLTLEQALQLALTHNSSLLRLGYETARREIDRQEARSRRRPDLDLDFELAERFGRRFDQSIGRIEDRRSTVLGVRAQSTFTLFDRKGHEAAVVIAERELAAGKEQSQWGRQRVLFEVSSRYMVILLDAVLIRIGQEHLQAQQEQLRRVEGFRRLGKRPHSDVLQQRAALSRAQLRLLDAERQLATDKLNLKDILGVEPQMEIELVGFDRSAMRRVLPTYDLVSLLDEALATRADIKSLAHALEASEEALRRARIHYWPQVDLFVSMGTDYTSSKEDLSLVDQLIDVNPNAIVGLSLSAPVLDRGIAKGALRRAQIAHREAALKLADQRRSIAIELQQALLDYNVAQQQLVVAREERAYAQEALKEIVTRYDKGMATVAELTQARAQHVEATGGEAVANHNVLLRQLAIDFFANRPSDTPISHVEEAH
jgi:outer membrane protein